jgi:RHS repeat-associated protein
MKKSYAVGLLIGLGLLWLVRLSLNNAGATGLQSATSKHVTVPARLTFQVSATSLSPQTEMFSHLAGNGTVAVTAPSGFAWNAASNDPWLTITGSKAGTGNGGVAYAVAANNNSQPRTGTLTIAGHTFTVLQGAQFNDVPTNNQFFDFIGKLSARRITLGCGNGNYCPGANVMREQMAAFLIRALHEPGYVPPPPAGQRFLDVPPSNLFYAHIEEMALRGITLGCGNNNYCPSANVTREQMAVFIIRALHEPGYNPPPPTTQRFNDVPISGPQANPFAAFIEEMAARGITLGCSANPPLYCPTGAVTREQMAAFLIRAFGVPPNQAPIANAGADQTIALPNSASLNGSFSDDGLPAGSLLASSWSKVSGPGTVTFGNPNAAATTASFGATGNYVLRLSVSDTLLSGSDDVSITVNPPPNQPPSVNAGADQSVTLPSRADLFGTASDDGLPQGSTLVIGWSKVSGPGPVIFSHGSMVATQAFFSVPGAYVLRLTANDSQLSSSDGVTVTVLPDPTPPPPDPATVAPPLDRTQTTTTGDGTEFLYTGKNPIQTGVAPGTINKVRVGVLRGRVLDKTGAPLSLVKVTILNHPEFGQTLTRADGKYDMAVNGGGMLTVNFQKQGFLPVQRNEDVPWQDYVCLPDVVMISYDDRVTRVELNANSPLQVTQANPVTDNSGTRQATLLFPQGTTAMMSVPGGGQQALGMLHVRATEYTVGAMGPKAMPGALPPTSFYTYASEFSVDEAVAVGATAVTFSQPVPFYLENFVGIPVGKRVPMAFYDRSLAQWVPEPDGRVIKILSIAGGLANLDTNGDGMTDNAATLAALGINDAERQRLATLYAVNQTLWRIPVQHFSPGDGNFPTNPPADATYPNQPPPKKDKKDDDPCKKKGSIIECQNQILGETLGVTGTPFTLNYASDRVSGRTASNLLTIALSGATLPASLARIDLEVEVAGQLFRQEFSPQPNQSFTYTWDGKDAYGRTLQGQQTAHVKLGYAYDALYQEPPSFPQSFGIPSGISFAGAGARAFVILNQNYQVPIGAWDARAQAGLGGWTLSPHHAYDPVGKILYQGDGTRRSAENVKPIISSVATISVPYKIAVASDGTVYTTDGNRIFRLNANGTTTVVAGGGGSTADGVPATQAFMTGINDIEIASDGSIYVMVNDQSKVRRIGTDGIIRTVAGNGTFGFSGDGGPALQAQFNGVYGIGLGPDGSLYIADNGNRRIRRVGADGRIATIAGNGQECFPCGGNGPAPQVAIGAPSALEVTPDGSVYFVNSSVILRVPADASRVIRVAGGGTQSYTTADGVPASEITYHNGGVDDIAFGADGLLYVTAGHEGIPSGSVVQLIDQQGLIYKLAGKTHGFGGDLGPARQGLLNHPNGVAVGPDDAIYIADRINNRVRKISAPLPGFSNGDITVPAEDGGLLYRFSPQGRHLSTINALTNATLLTFGYDSASRLITITDADNNVTTIERNGSGNPTGILSPFGQRTTLTLDANGFLASVTNPASESVQLTYNSTGLLTKLKDPRNNEYLFEYDALGRLTKDTDPASGFQSLALTEFGLNGANKDVQHKTALNRNTLYRTEQLQSGVERRTNTAPDGTQTQHSFGPDRRHTLTFADGVTATFTESGDPRFGMGAPFITSQTVRMPSSLQATITGSRVAQLTDPTNLASLITLTDTFTLNGQAYTSTYTAATRTTVSASPLNRQTTTTTNVQGRTVSAQTAGLHPAAFTYDNRGRLSTLTAATGAEARTASFAYNANGFLQSITDPLQRVVSYLYDAAGRETSKTLPDGRVIQFGYDANGNLTSLTPPGRPAHTFTYNAVNLPTAYTPPNVGAGTNATLYSYNQDRQLTRIARPDGINVDYAYDSAGRLSTLTQPRGATTYNYNATTGRLASIAAPGGITQTFTYDGSLLTSETLSGPVAGSVQRTYANFFRTASLKINNANPITFTYDNDSLLTQAGGLQLTRNAQNGLLSATSIGNVADTLARNGFGEVTTYNATFNGNALYTVQYTFDKLGRITAKTETLGGVSDTYEYAYDLAGRLTQVKKNGVAVATYTYDSNGNRLSFTGPGGSLNATYDNQDRMTQYGGATYAYTANGELQSKTVAGQTTNYQYDTAGNLMAVTLPAGTQIAYLVDGENRRIGKQVNGTLTRGFLYEDGLRISAELNGSNNVISRFVYATGVNVPDYMVKAGVTYRLVTDHLGSVRTVVDTATGAVVQRIDYDEFGRVLADTSPGFQPFGFAGGLYDPDTGLVRFGARDYDAETGRWTAKDPIIFEGDDTNLYAYVFNDPVNTIDPVGTDVPEFLKPIFGALAGKQAQFDEGVKKKKEQVNDKVTKTLRPYADLCEVGDINKDPNLSDPEKGLKIIDRAKKVAPSISPGSGPLTKVNIEEKTEGARNYGKQRDRLVDNPHK